MIEGYIVLLISVTIFKGETVVVIIPVKEIEELELPNKSVRRKICKKHSYVQNFQTMLDEASQHLNHQQLSSVKETLPDFRDIFVF